MRNRHVVVVLVGIVCLVTLAASSSAQAPPKTLSTELFKSQLQLTSEVYQSESDLINPRGNRINSREQSVMSSICEQSR